MMVVQDWSSSSHNVLVTTPLRDDFQFAVVLPPSRTLDCGLNYSAGWAVEIRVDRPVYKGSRMLERIASEWES